MGLKVVDGWVRGIQGLGGRSFCVLFVLSFGGVAECVWLGCEFVK